MPLLRRQAGAPRFRGQGLRRAIGATIRLVWRGLFALIVLLCLYLLAAVAGALWPGPVAQAPQDMPGDPVEIRLVAGPIHYDFLLPLTPATRRALAPLAQAGLALDRAGAQWLVVGWGSRAFYTHEGSYADVPAATLWRAVTGDAAVLRADLAGPLPPGYPALSLRLSPGQYARLLQGIAADIRTGPGGAPRALGAPGFTDSDLFVEAAGRFHLFRTCNTWVARRLRAAGVAFGRWTPTPYAVTLSHRRFHPG